MKRITAYKMDLLGWTLDVGLEEACPLCTHKWGPHVLACNDAVQPMAGGTVSCPEKDCGCSGTWGPATRK